MRIKNDSQALSIHLNFFSVISLSIFLKQMYFFKKEKNIAKYIFKFFFLFHSELNLPPYYVNVLYLIYNLIKKKMIFHKEIL